MSKATTLHVNDQRKRKLDRLALEVSYKSGKMITWTELVNYTLDNYLDDAVKDLIHSTDKKE
ncbi:MAG: hypothetical protein GX667_04330 [Xanthomonadaceae bacterium]|nr:hypothetical protein [Xanthomonadaceae bacterium]